MMKMNLFFNLILCAVIIRHFDLLPWSVLTHRSKLFSGLKG